MSGLADSKLTLNFFYFLLADESMALYAASQTIKNVNKKIMDEPNQDKEVLLVSEMLKTLKQIRKKRIHKRVAMIHGMAGEQKAEWTLPQPKLFARWRDCVSKIETELSIVLILRYILKLSISVIAKAMQVPEGTILYRIGRALDLLTQMNSQESEVPK